jgi:hypothetical protein
LAQVRSCPDISRLPKDRNPQEKETVTYPIPLFQEDFAVLFFGGYYEVVDVSILGGIW